ncbi:peroxiredoxin-like family protein [Paucibacter sediminis]|uniref:Peroxiredoxin-like family protein n=1 Tax=Paucibacter sediminis TaxID=3019553 RepID=A0AA95SPT7_9BURK|nr:peroxiredoxin-like family protein [Paucibacter sp. S2-9]WIT14122.1 peroxiredoxin-like family protein [Paucibacter sp. S2-9]
MPLQEGALAPEFVTADMFGQSIRLSDFKGRPVLLSFMRYASCPMCNLRVRDMVLAHERLARAGLVMLVVFQSSAESMGEYVGRQDSPFSLIPDPEMHLYRLYGVERSWAGLLAPANVFHAFRAFFRGFLPGRVDGPIDRMPADFLIGADGRIERAFYARAAAEHVPLSEVTSWVHGRLPSTGNGSVEGTA